MNRFVVELICDVLNPSSFVCDGAAAVASEPGGGSNKHACLLYSFFFLSLSLTGEVPAMVSQGHHYRFPSASCKSCSNRPLGTGSVSLFCSSVYAIY
jgi:hypothetical protein